MQILDCPCGGTMKQTAWKPGYCQDPLLRQYKCKGYKFVGQKRVKSCGRIEYLVDNETYMKSNRLNQGRMSTK